MTTRTRLALLVPAALLVVALVGCGSSSKSSGTAATVAAATGSSAASSAVGSGADSGAVAVVGDESAARAAGAPSTAAAATTAAAAASSQAAPSAQGSIPDSTVGVGGVTPLPADGRKIIVTVTLDMQVDDVSSSVAKARAFAEGVGGEVFSEQTNLVADNPSSTMTLKVPPSKVNNLLTSLGQLGKVLTQGSQADDVTAQFVDLESRLVSAERSVARARDFLDKAEDVAQLASLEAELTRRETERDQLLGQKRVLEAHVDLATVTLTLKPTPPVATTTTVAPTTTTTVAKATVSRALRNGKRSVGGFLNAVAIVLAFLLPWSPFIALGAVLIWVGRRRARRAAAARAVSQPMSTAGYPATAYPAAQGWPVAPVAPAGSSPVAAEPVPAGVGGRGASPSAADDD